MMGERSNVIEMYVSVFVCVWLSRKSVGCAVVAPLVTQLSILALLKDNKIIKRFAVSPNLILFV